VLTLAWFVESLYTMTAKRTIYPSFDVLADASRASARKLSDRDLNKIEPILRKVLRRHFERDFSFDLGTYGDLVLQASRVRLFMLAQTYAAAMRILTDPLEASFLFKSAVREVDPPGANRRFIISLDEAVGDSGHSLLEFFDAGIRKGTLGADLVLVHERKNLCDITQVLGDSWHNLLDQYRDPTYVKGWDEELSRMVRILETGGNSKSYHDIYSVYSRNLAALCDRLQDGQISSWRSLRRSHISFFDWDVNLRGVIRHITERLILPSTGLSLEDLPLQKALRKHLIRHKIELRHRFRYPRDLFCFGYPEMADSPHWHPSRWWLKEKPRDSRHELANDRYRRDYLFRHKLKCKTRDDVLAILNDEERLHRTLSQENMLRHLYRSSGLELRGRAVYKLIADLPVEMFFIEPWELQSDIPKDR
jgi:hypothetical protein